MVRRSWLIGAIIAGFLMAGLLPPAVAAQDVCVVVQGTTRVQAGTASCTATDESIAIAVGSESTAMAGEGSTAIAVNGSYAEGRYESRVRAVNGSTATANTDVGAVREGCSLTATNGAIETCP